VLRPTSLAPGISRGRGSAGSTGGAPEIAGAGRIGSPAALAACPCSGPVEGVWGNRAVPPALGALPGNLQSDAAEGAEVGDHVLTRTDRRLGEIEPVMIRSIYPPATAASTPVSLSAACAAASRASGTRKGEQET
jgi:hypothetical protein